MQEAFVFLLVMLGLGAPFLIGLFLVHYFRYRAGVAERMTQMRKKMAELGTTELREQVEALQTRVEVLEAVVTDKKLELDEKIANL